MNIKTCMFFLLTLALQTQGAEPLKYVLAPGSTITPYDGAMPTGSAEPLAGYFTWISQGYVTGTIIGYNAVELDFQSASCRLLLNTTLANDIGSAVHTDSTLTVFDEVADLSGLTLAAGYVSSLTGGTYSGPPTRPAVLNYPNVALSPLGGGVFAARLNLMAVLEELVNVAPSFAKGPDITVRQNCGTQTVAHWATEISAGPPRESRQTLNFIIATDNPGLFAAGPAIAADGTLTFTPARDQNGVAHISVILHDSGGTAYGGQDTSAPQIFTITVLSPCQALQSLAAEIQEANVPRSIKNSLLASLRTACDAFERERWAAGAQHLSVFQKKVRLQVAPHYPDLAQQWLAEAQSILEMLPQPAERRHLAPALRPQAD